MAGPDYFFCIAHEPPWFNLPGQVEVIATGAYQGPGRLNIRDSKLPMGAAGSNIAAHYQYLTGTAGALYASELLNERETAGKSVCIFQYRKLISRGPIGARSDVYPYMRVLPMPVGDELVAEILASYTSDTLVAHPFLMEEGLLGQYARCHHVADFLLLTHIATRLRILDEAEVLTFFHTRLFIPGGVEFGVFPCALFIGIMEKVRAVLDKFLESHLPTNSENEYQRRGLSFFAERLSNYLLIKALGWPTLAQEHCATTLPLPPENIGYMCTVSDTGDYRTFGQHPVTADAEGVMDLGTGSAR